MLKVGVPWWLDPIWFSRLPSGIEIERVEASPERTIEVEFWIPPVTPREATQALPHLRGVRIVQSLYAGVDWLIPLLPPGLVLCDAQGLHNIPTAEWTVSAILAALKYFPFYFEVQQSADWRRRREADDRYRAMFPDTPTSIPLSLEEELYGKRVLIVGYGSIGQAIEQRLLPFDVEIVRVARRDREGVESVDRLFDLLPTADVIVLIVPLTPETVGLIGEGEFAAMKQGALLVNAARGPVVKTDALLAALDSGRIRAVLDVTDPEPLPPEHPLWKAPNVFITPHVAATTPAFVPRALDFISAQLNRYMKGEPLVNIVTGHY
ncbi:MAG TPA: 2-hydroxyacid dehydrogenase [Silvibacterium sp.]|nr:2-hydroxyacid dehydrogenase [Silvibacterium sp.]